jgi:hypothetical protein
MLWFQHLGVELDVDKEGLGIHITYDTVRIIKTNLMHCLSSVYFVNHLCMFRACYCLTSGGITIYSIIHKSLRDV